MEDLADLALEASRGNENVEIDTVGTEVFTYREMVKMVRDKMGSRCLVVPSPKWLTYVAGRVLGYFLDDIVLTMDEIQGPLRWPLGLQIRLPNPLRPRSYLSGWTEMQRDLGQRYASEVQRHYR